jgi:3-mercaptopyruvate sulfurtransferase SseA
VALLLKRVGITQVRPLLGGLEAWSRLGYPLEVITEEAAIVAEPASAPAADSSADASSLSLGGQ